MKKVDNSKIDAVAMCYLANRDPSTVGGGGMCEPMTAAEAEARCRKLAPDMGCDSRQIDAGIRRGRAWLGQLS